jgi:hypothetical protein
MAGKSQNVMALVLTLGVTAVAKMIVDRVWKLGSGGKTPPTDPSDPDVNLSEAVVWAVISGAIISVARMALSRKLAQKERRQQRVEQRAHA